LIQPQSDSGIDSYRERVSKFSSELDLGLIFYILKKSLWIVLLFFIICFSAAFIYLRYSQPVYQSSTVIQINDNNEASKVLQIGTTEGATNKIAEAIEQIRSKIFLKRVIEKSNVQVSYFNEGTFKSNELYKF
jgi:tyrosine-protein kinase Etk/Wzc